MIYDSNEWRQERDKRLLDAVGDPDALGFLLTVFQIAETWDDLIDRDKPVTDADIHRAFWLALIQLPDNPFYARYQVQLTPVMATTMNAWIDSTQLEHGTKQERAVAYGLRDAYLELISLVILLTRGYDAMRAHTGPIRSFLMDTHETFDDYMNQGAQP